MTAYLELFQDAWGRDPTQELSGLEYGDIRGLGESREGVILYNKYLAYRIDL